MTTVYDVEAQKLIEKTKEKLEKIKEIAPPPWAAFVKSGTGQERPPEQPDWWHCRAASVLRKIYINGPLGVGKLRKAYSTRKGRGHKPEHSYPAGGSAIRKILQQLEKAGFVKKTEQGGRAITPKGQSFLDRVAYEIKEG